MADVPTPEMLNFASESTNDKYVSSHLSQPRIRTASHSSIHVKRIKPNNVKSRNEDYAMAQLESAKLLVFDAVNLVFHGEPLRYGYSFYCQKVEAICKYKHAEPSRISGYLKQQIEGHFYSHVVPAIKDVLQGENILMAYLEVYNLYEMKLRDLGKIFLYLDRSYLLQHPHKKVILELGLDLFVDNLLAEPLVDRAKLISIYTANLKREFTQDTPLDLPLIGSFTKMLIKLNYSKKIRLNKAIIDLCVDLFTGLRQEWSKNYSTYIHNSLLKISSVMTFFKQSGQDKAFCEQLLIKLKWVCIFQDFNSIIQNCLSVMLQDGHERQLCKIYSFCELTNKEYGLDSMPIFVNKWGQIMTEQINGVITKEPGVSGNVVHQLVSIFHKYKSIVDQRFNGNEKFEFEIRHSFSRVLNSSRKINGLTINQLCKYSDNFLKSKKPDMAFSEFEANFMIIFKFLNNKSDFIINYKNQLSRRLLLGKNSNIEQEKSLVLSICQIVGENEDSIGLNVMFKDLSKSQMHYSNMKLDIPLEFNGLILEKKYWPEIPKPDNTIILPSSFLTTLAQFEEVYKKLDDKFKNHRLDWGNYNLHQLVIIGRFDSGNYELNVNLLQAIVIEMFKDNDQLTMEQLINLTNMDSKLLTRVIHSLSDKYKLLEQHDNFITINHQFTEKSKKLRIPLPRDKEYSVSSGKEEIIHKNRDSEIRGLIIRTIKIETTMNYNDLLTQTLEKIGEKGPVTVTDVKTNIEYLIDKEYMTRDNNKLVYIP